MAITVTPVLPHRPLVYAEDSAQNVYAAAYGWWCMDCTAGRDAEIDPTNKANAEKQAKRHADAAGDRITGEAAA